MPPHKIISQNIVIFDTSRLYRTMHGTDFLPCTTAMIISHIVFCLAVRMHCEFQINKHAARVGFSSVNEVGLETQ